MKLNRIADMARQAIDKRGGMDALRQDLNEVRDVATGRGSLRDKARAAAEALKQPGANAETPPATSPPAAADPDAPPAARVHPDPQAPDAA